MKRDSEALKLRTSFLAGTLWGRKYFPGGKLRDLVREAKWTRLNFCQFRAHSERGLQSDL